MKLVAEAVVKEIVSKSISKIKPDLFKTSKSEFKNLITKFPDNYENHFHELCKWALSIPFIGLSDPKKTETSTIELIIGSDILKHTKDSNGVKISEDHILNSEENILLVGAPGAGKTTTLKRLIISYLTTMSEKKLYGFPILVRLREIPPNTTLSKYILDIFNIKYEDRVVETVTEIEKIDKNGSKFKKSQIVKKNITLVDETPILIFLPKLLNSLETFLLLDGLDEIEKSIQPSIIKEIETIGFRLTKSKILLTVRKSELNKIIENFTFYDIAPLNEEQIKEISKKWVANSDEFIEELNKKPYKDLANRPIFLTLLLVLFGKYNFLPTQPSEVYDDATYLIVKEWDEQRDIIRTSKYSDFTTRKKIKFLSELSYLLTYKIKQKVFSSKELEIVYNDIYSKYFLPLEEMKIVVSEIESHTGIIVESGYKNFEFSHLSIQEYLCAKHLVNLPYSQETIQYFLLYPEPLAIAISISGEPSLWFSNLILNKSLNINNFKKSEYSYSSSLYSFLNRLLLEKPSFRSLMELGFSFLYILTHTHQRKDFESLLLEFYEYPNVKISLGIALNDCSFLNNYNGHYLISRKHPVTSDYFIEFPSTAEIPENIFNKLLKDKIIELRHDKIIFCKN